MAIQNGKAFIAIYSHELMKKFKEKSKAKCKNVGNNDYTIIY